MECFTSVRNDGHLRNDGYFRNDGQIRDDGAVHGKPPKSGSGFLQAHRDKLLVLDEVQYVPEVFAQLRPEIDAQHTPGRFLLLGSACGRLLQQSSGCAVVFQ